MHLVLIINGKEVENLCQFR